MESRIALFYRKLFLPIFPVAVFQQHGDGRGDCLSMPHARKNSRGVALDLHSSAPAIALLATPKLPIYEFQVNTQAGRQSRKECDQRLPVRLP